jgi:hypothetical protein
VKRAGVVLEPREFPCGFFYMKDLVYSIPIDIIEVLIEPVGNTATLIRNNRGMQERGEIFIGAFIIVLTITAVPLNTSCN